MSPVDQKYRNTIVGEIMALEREGRYEEAAYLRKRLGDKWVLSRKQRVFLFLGRVMGFNR